MFIEKRFTKSTLLYLLLSLLLPYPLNYVILHYVINLFDVCLINYLSIL